MNPVELNTLITAVTNYLYCSLPEKDFFNLGIFLSLLSRNILAMETVRDLVKIERKVEEKEEKK